MAQDEQLRWRHECRVVARRRRGESSVGGCGGGHVDPSPTKPFNLQTRQVLLPQRTQHFDRIAANASVQEIVEAVASLGRRVVAQDEQLRWRHKRRVGAGRRRGEGRGSGSNVLL